MRHLFLLLLLLAAPAAAQPLWVPSDAGIDGVEAQTLHEAPGGALYVGTVGGAYRSLDRRTWTQLPFVDGRWTSSIVTPRPRVVIVTSSRERTLSTDDGATWQILPNGARGAGHIITVDSSGGLLARENPFREAPARLVRSTDLGMTWTPVDSTGGPHTNAGPGVTLADGTIITTGNDRIFRSDDLGRTWQSFSFGDNGMQINSIAITSGGALVIASNRGIHRWRDDWRVWDAVSEGGARHVTRAASTLFANADLAFEGDRRRLLRSDDDGISWQTVDTSAPAPILGLRDGSLVGGRNDRMVISSDGGVTWSDITSGLRSYRVSAITAAAGRSLFMTNGWAGERRFSASTDGGATWSSRDDTSRARPTALVVADDGSVVMGRSFDYGIGSIERSTDGGASWLTAEDSVMGEVKQFHRRDDGVLFAAVALESGFGVYTGGIYRSDDNGATWTRLGFYRPTRAIAFLPSGELVVAAYMVNDHSPVFSGSLWRMKEDGSDSVEIAPGLEAFDLVRSGETLIASGRDDVYRSTDAGTTWLPTGTSAELRPQSLALDGTGVLYGGGERNGVVRSRDVGLTWEPVNDGLLTRTIADIVATPWGEVFAATGDNGLYRLTGSSGVPLRVLPFRLWLE